MKQAIKIVFFGTPSFAVPVLEALDKNFQVVGVVTNPDQKVGRKQILTPSLVAEYAQKCNIPVLKPEKSLENWKLKIENFHPDLGVVVAYGKILPKSVLDIPKYGVLNIHYSLLPKYRGASPIQAAILNGDKVSGTSIMKMDEKLDHGPILITKEITLSDQDTFESLNTQMTHVTIPLLIGIIPDFIAGKVEMKPQNEGEATYTKIIKKEDGYFDISDSIKLKELTQLSLSTIYHLPSTTLDRMIRAFYPWPGVWTKWCPSSALKASPFEAKIVKFYPNKIIQMEGKKPVRLEDFLRGYPNFPIKSL